MRLKYVVLTSVNRDDLPDGGAAHYAAAIRASKRVNPQTAVEALTRELAESWAADGVAVAAIAIGRFATESLRKYPAELWQTAAKTVPLQRLGEVEEYGWLVALLASPLGRSFSGSVVTLDGAADNWTGPWPPEGLVRDGEVPTEQRRSARASPD